MKITLNVCLSDYNYIRNHYRLIVIDLSKLKELDADPKAVQQKELVGQLKKTNDNTNVEYMFILMIFE